MWNSNNNNPNDHRNRHYPPPQPPPGYHYRQSPPTYPDPRYPPHHPYGYGPYWPPPPPHLGDRPRSGSHGENVYYPEARRQSGDHSREEETSMPTASKPDDKAFAEVTVSEAAPRGKPEAMAQALAAAKIESKREEIAEMKRKEEDRMKDGDEDDIQEDMDVEVEVEAEAVPEEDEDEAIAEPLVQPVTSSSKKSDSKKKSPTRKKKPSKPRLSSSSLETTRSSLLKRLVYPVSEEEWGNLDALMNQFCRVPLLAEFSRPVSLLHPELITTYSKIVKHPLDLGHVCRGIRRRQYKNLRDVRLDMWRVFANCVKYHSHPNNKEAVPSFVSIALHLREYFNSLWNEYMLPSDLPENASATIKEMFQTRQHDRKLIMENSGVLTITKKIVGAICETIKTFVKNGGRVDALDKDDVFGPHAKENDPDLEVVVANLMKVQEQLNTSTDDYALEPFYKDLKAAYTSDVLEENPALRNRIENRVTRMFWKLFLPLHEANSRGVSQSSIWGNMAAAIWARDSSKKPFWPALCLGILAPEDQIESWHDRITARNEMRLPEKLRAPLEASKNKCLLQQQRHSFSYFLVEFLGTHEFIWVRETDIIENFDAEKDPNKDSAPAAKKKRSSRSATSNVVGSKTYATALEECTWAMEEYESVLQDCYALTGKGENANDEVDEEEDGDDVNYSYALLAQSDDEADDEDTHGYAYDDSAMSLSDVDEANFLLEHEGLLDTSSAGRKNAKKRALAMKKKSSEKNGDVKSKGRKDVKPKKDSKRKDAQRAKEEKLREAQRAKDLDREQKKEEKESEKRRKKRMREREKALRLETRKNKKRRSSVGNEDDDRGLTLDKRARATAIVKAYLTRLAQDDDFKNLGIGGVMNIPAVMIDSTGLLGMALAFRSAAGEIPVPDDGEESIAKLKPWATIDTESQKTSAERIEALRTKIGHLEERIKRKRSDITFREERTQEAIAKRVLMEERIKADDELARRNPFKKKKRYPSPKSMKKPNQSTERNDDAEDDEDDDVGSEKPGVEDDDNGDDEDDDKTAADSASQSDEDVESAASADNDAMDVENS